MDDYESLHQRALARMLPLRPRYKSRRTSSQSQCPLFAILPPEIRRLIWIECLGGLVLPLSFPVHYRCDRICIHGALARIRLYCNPQCHSPVKTRIERSLLPILLTCQRMYGKQSIPLKQICNAISNIWLQILGSYQHSLLLQYFRFSQHKLPNCPS